MKHAALGLVAAALVGFSNNTWAEVISLEWDAQGRVDKTLPVAPGRFVEACGALPQGARVQWRFEAGGPLDFNIHYHLGQEVKYPARQAQVAKDQGTLEASTGQDYCWMWTNKAGEPVTLKFQLTRG
jgi:hypothetical protein